MYINIHINMYIIKITRKCPCAQMCSKTIETHKQDSAVDHSRFSLCCNSVSSSNTANVLLCEETVL